MLNYYTQSEVIMRVRLHETGEIKEGKLTDSGLFFYKEGNVEYYLRNQYDVLNNIDWEQRRWELIKVTFQGFLVHKSAMSDNLLVNRVFELADAVLEKYRKEGEE